jgi:hypothetical protein
MSKRVNPKRRLLARQAATLAGVRKEQSVAHAEEMSKLQQGHVRSGLRGNPTTKVYRGPNWSSEDVPGKAKRSSKPRFTTKGGKIVGGKFIPDPKA